jgi:TP901 family phage tail tape measure protein
MGRKFSVEIPIIAKNLTKEATAQVLTNLERIEDRVKKLNEVGGKFQAVGSAFQSAGMKMGIAGAAIGAGLGIAGKQAIDEETNFLKIANTIGTTVPKAIDDYSQGLQTISIQTANSMDDMTAAFTRAKVAGISDAEIMDYMGVASKTATGSFATTTEVVAGLSKIMGSFNIATSDAMKTAEKIAIANRISGATFQEFADVIGPVSIMANDFGAGFEDSVAALSVMRKVTGDASMAVSQFQNILNAIANPSENTAKVLDIINEGLSGKDKLIFSVEELEKVGLAGWLDKLRTATGGSATAINALFGSNKRAKLGVMELMSKYDLYTGTLGKMNKATNQGAVIEDNFANATRTAGFSFKQLKIEIEELLQSIGGPLLESIKSVINFINRGVLALIEFAKEHKTLTKALVFAAAAFSVFLVIGGSLLAFVGTLIGWIGGIIVAWGTWMTATAAIMPILSVVGSAIAGLIGFFGWWAVAIAAAAVVVADFVSGFVYGFLRGIMPVLKVVGGAISTFFGMVWGWIKQLIGAIGWFFKKVFEIGEKLGYALGSGITDALGLAPAAAEKAANKTAEVDAKAQDKITNNRAAELDERLSDFMAAKNKAKKIVEAVNIFSGADVGSFITENVAGSGIGGPTASSGFATEKIAEATAAAGPRIIDNKKSIHIARLELPSVTDPSSFIFELEKLSTQGGIA